MDDHPKWRFACSECGILDERHRPETCPQCGDEVLDLENGSDQIFLYELFKQHRGRRWLRGFCFGFFGMGAVWAALLFVLLMTEPRLTGFAELIPLLMLDLGQWLVVGGAVLFAWGYSRWKLSRQPAPVQNLEALLFRQHQSDTLRSVITSPAVLSVVLLSVGFAGMLAGHQETVQRFALLPSALLDGERLWTLITSIFLHGDILHLASNLLGLLLFGVVIDLRLGHLRTALIMLGCGIAGGIAHSLFTPEPQQLLIGASAVVYGLLGANLILVPMRKIPIFLMGMPLQIPTFVIVLLFATVFTAVDALMHDHIAWMAHLGGLGFGVLATLPFRNLPVPPVKQRLEQRRAENLREMEMGI